MNTGQFTPPHGNATYQFCENLVFLNAKREIVEILSSKCIDKGLEGLVPITYQDESQPMAYFSVPYLEGDHPGAGQPGFLHITRDFPYLCAGLAPLPQEVFTVYEYDRKYGCYPPLKESSKQ